MVPGEYNSGMFGQQGQPTAPSPYGQSSFGGGMPQGGGLMRLLQMMQQRQGGMGSGVNGPAGTGGYSPVPQKPMPYGGMPTGTGGYSPIPQQPRMMDGSGMLGSGLNTSPPPQQPRIFDGSAGVRDAQGNVYADRNSTPRAYTAGAFVPGTSAMGGYGGSGGYTQQNGMNYINGKPFAEEGLTQGGANIGPGNFWNTYGSWLSGGQHGAPAPGMHQPSMPQQPGMSNGFGGGGIPPPFDPSRGGMPGGAPPANPLGRGTDPLLMSGIDPRTGLPMSRSPYLK